MYTDSQKAQYILWYHDCNQDYSQFAIKFRRELGKRAHVPDYRTVRNWMEKFTTEGSVKDRKSPGRPVSTKTEENIQAVHNAFNAAGSSLRLASQNLGTFTSILNKT